MQVRQSIHSDHAKQLDTAGLRREFLIEQIFSADAYTMTYSHIDRIIVGGIMPVHSAVTIGGEVGKQLGVSYFTGTSRIRRHQHWRRRHRDCRWRTL